MESVYEKDYVKISEGSNIGGNLKKHLKGLNKKMKDYINLFHDIIDKFHFWDNLNKERKQEIIANYTSNSKNSSFLLGYFESFLISLKKNTLNSYIKSVIKN